MKLLKKALLTLGQAALIWAAGACLGEFDGRDVAIVVLTVIAVLLVPFTYWLWRGQREND